MHFDFPLGGQSGLVVECFSRDRGVAGSSLTSITVLCPWARPINPCLVLVQPRKDPSRHNWKIVDGDVKNQSKHPLGACLIQIGLYQINNPKVQALVTWQ